MEFLVIYLLGIFTRCYELNMAEMNTNFGIHFFVVEFFKIWGVGGDGEGRPVSILKPVSNQSLTHQLMDFYLAGWLDFEPVMLRC